MDYVFTKRQRGGAVGDDDEGVAVGVGGKAGQKGGFGFGVEGGGGFVEQEKAAFAQEGAGYGDPLGLAFAQAASSFAADGIQTFREFKDEVGGCQVQHLAHLCLTGLRVAEQQVVTYAAAHQGIALWHKYYIAAREG